jgi:hypothetical protein
MPCVKGSSGNPSGRAPGSKNKATQIRDAIGDQIPEIIAALVEQARQGDVPSARLILERVLPPVRAVGPTVDVDLEGFEDGDLAARTEAVMLALGRGEIPVDVGQTLLSAISTQASIMETAELTQRISRLEEALLHGQG